MMLRLSIQGWSHLRALLAAVGWWDDLKRLGELEHISIIDDQQFLSMPDDFLNRLRKLQGELSWFERDVDTTWMHTLVEGITGFLCSQWVPAQEVPAQIQAEMASMPTAQAKEMELSTPVHIPTEADFVRALGEEAYSLLHSESKPWVWPEK